MYCTGWSLWLSSRALIGSPSPLIVRPTLLQPLSAGGVVEALHTTKDLSGRSLLDSVAVAPPLVEYFAARAQAITGGVGRGLQFLLRARQREGASGSRMLHSPEEVDVALERLMPRLARIPGVMLRVQWDGPAEAAAAGDVPNRLQQHEVQLKLLQLLARMLLLDPPFDSDSQIELAPERVRLSDAAVVLGMSYGPAPGPSDSGAAVLRPKSRTHLRLIAGEWLCRSLLDEPSITSRPAVLASAQLLATMRSFGGTMRGRPFEMLCADALCARSLLAPGQRLADLLPHLSRSLRANELVPALRVVALPKAVSDAKLPRLSDAVKDKLLRAREDWTSDAVVHAGDLPWILSQWASAALVCPQTPSRAHKTFFFV